ncbi:dockerin-like protein [Mucilaginibacter galii]|uniref:4-O-methyl-glucuronoyl methylesterase-like domain-containing protein n=1 Tax=Mucilaginibacter galii TaxID=2005073 RepID=A0A917MZM4_9SPHI|nr:dockerin-like protein [Mucilaginibacter galii]GGI49146.1 hypothetical protein GCM10011425_03580 [Mucilaginibacter galii]
MKIRSLLFCSAGTIALLTAIIVSCKTHGGNIVQSKGELQAMPSYASLPSNPKLPDPFKMMNGKRVTTKKEWARRQTEIAALAQEFEYGYKPNTPASATTGAFNNNTITVTVNNNGKTIMFNCTITYPTTGSKPYPAMIGIGMSNLNNAAILNLGVAVINFPNNQVAQQSNASSRGKGLFYDMFGSDHSASATMAWAWGVSRLIDALEKTPLANINAARLGVTGCSRNGKGALAVGAFEERIKLTIPQEPGAGGAASWRVSDAQILAGKKVQTISQIVTENVWFRENFSQFGKTADKLPFDQHSVMALVAPRALLIIDNTSIDWLSPVSAWITANAAHKVWQSLGVPDRMGFSQVGAHNHCAFPDAQLPELTAYIQKFLLDNNTPNTNVMKSDGDHKYDEATWVDWTAPGLR